MKNIIACVFTLVFFHCLLAQDIIISGSVKDENGAVLAGVTVLEKGKKTATATGVDGQFKLKVSKVPTTLVFSAIGFQRQQVTIKDAHFLKVSLRTENSIMEDVVVIGQQKQALRKTTSSLQVISGKEIENLPAPSFESLLQGRVSGVNIQNFSGEPGVRNTFTIRGNSTLNATLYDDRFDLAKTLSSPLYIIDGIPLSVTDLATSSATGTNYIAGININDIESIVIQKDAAATAVWGSRGANGVVVIKTKVGQRTKPQIRISYYKGITERPNLQRTFVGAAERQKKLEIIEAYAGYQDLGNIPQPLTDSLNASYNNATDWQSLSYRTGNIDNVDFSIAAVSPLVNYRLSLGYYNEDGIIRNSGFKRYTLRSNFGFNLTSFLHSDLIFSLARIDRKRGLGLGPNNIVPIGQGFEPASFVQLGPNEYDFYNGFYDKIIDDNKSDVVNVFSKTYIDLFKGLQYSFEGSVQGNFDKRNRFQPREINNGINFASSDNNISYTYNIANILNYNKSFGNNNILITGSQSFQYDNYRSTNLIGENLKTDDIHVVQGVASKDLKGSTDVRNSGLLSFLGQFAYDYNSKYIFNMSIRGDASSRFGKESKWGYFPSFSAAWIASDEQFIKNIKFIDFLKLRASWGKTGTLPGDFYAPYNVWNLSTTTYNGNSIATPSFSKPLTLRNLTWEKSSQTNIGFDLNMLNSRFTIVFDTYRKITEDPILFFPIPFYTGYANLSYNVPMTIYNEGFELSITTRNFPTERKFQWNTNFNLSYNKNRIGSLPNNNKPFRSQQSGYGLEFLFNTGSPIYQWTQVLYNGVYNRLNEVPVNPYTGQRITYYSGSLPIEPGFPVWVDSDADGLILSYDDLLPTGDPNPKFTGGIFNEFFYKNFSLGILGTFTFGRDIVNLFKSYPLTINLSNVYSFTNLRLPDLDGVDYWTPEKAKDPNYKAGFQSISPYGIFFDQYNLFTTQWNENGNYFKIKSLTLGYVLPEKTLAKLNWGISRVRFYGVLDNVLTLQSATVPDAEAVDPQGAYIGFSYPLPRKYTLGVEISF